MALYRTNQQQPNCPHQTLERQLQEADRKSKALEDEKELMSLEMAARSVVSPLADAAVLVSFILSFFFFFFFFLFVLFAARAVMCDLARS